jgi:hypothetical protein
MYDDIWNKLDKIDDKREPKIPISPRLNRKRGTSVSTAGDDLNRNNLRLLDEMTTVLGRNKEPR